MGQGLSGVGAVDTEVMEGGLGVLPGIVPLPHSKKRVDFKNRVALRLFARRFEPDLCVLLDDGDRIDWDGRGWKPHKGCRRLDRGGEVREVAR